VWRRHAARRDCIPRIPCDRRLPLIRHWLGSAPALRLLPEGGKNAVNPCGYFFYFDQQFLGGTFFFVILRSYFCPADKKTAVVLF
jgi:hypothetical protein